MAPIAGPDAASAPPPDTPTWRPRHRSRRRRFGTAAVGLAALGALGVAGWFGLQRLGGTDESTQGAGAEPIAENPATLFGETQQLVDDINEDPGVAEAFEELGLDPTGGPLPSESGADPSAADPAPSADIASYAFGWTDPFGLSVDVQVDRASGNFVATTNDGTEIRRIGERHFGRAAGASWVELSPDVVSGIPVLGIDGPLDESVIPADLEPYVLGAATDPGWTRVLIDDATLATTDPGLRQAWLGPWGLLDPAAAVESTPFAGAFPAEAGSGQIIVSIARSPDGLVSEVTVSSPAIGGTAAYRLASTGINPLPVEIPAELAGG